MTNYKDIKRIPIVAADVPNLAASKITSGTLDNARITLDAAEIPNLATSKITTGTMADARISASSVTQHASTFDDNKIQTNIALLGFKTAVNGSLAKYNLVDQIVDEYTDDTGIDASASTNEVRTGGYVYAASGSNPTGGTITEYSGYRSHTFTATGSFVTPSSTGNIDVLVVAGGGGAGRGHGGGGGAGGYILSTTLGLSASTTYTATIGAGGAAQTSDWTTGNSGVNSTFAGSGISTITALKGGAGAGAIYNTNGIGGSGTYGSGGGGLASGSSGGAGTSGQGYAGGGGSGTNGQTAVASGGGGGATSVGVNAADTVTGGNGGTGIANTYKTGSTLYYAGGGGGRANDTAGTGGSGVGGNGATNASTAAGEPTANTGSGGGGTAIGYNSTGGADGTVIIRYADTEYLTIVDLTLQSNDTTASTANPNYADMIVLMENGTGTATLNTDIKGFISEDSGVTFTEGVLVEEGSWGTNKKIIAFHDLDISAQSGSAMCYKITTHNQSASKVTKVHATSIGWR